MNEMMAREIAAQAELLPTIQPELARRADALARPKGRVFAGGCGDSLFAPKALSEVFRLLRQPVATRSAMDMAAFTDFRPGDTVVLSSISGGTRRTVEAAGVAAAAGARVIALTCTAGSALAEAAHATIVLPFTPLSRKTPHTLDYAVTLLALAEIARSFAGEAASGTRPAVAAVPGLLDRARMDAADAAGAYDPAGKIVILGAGPDLGTAEYGAAKFHEAGGLVAIAAETENFIHGMNFMLEPCDLLIALGGSMAGRRRGGEITEALAPLVKRALSYAPDLAAGSDLNPWQTALAMVWAQTFFLQALCLRLADRLGLKLEEPRAGRAEGESHLAAQARAMAR
ncbi:MAG: SIS domain-containing protein [Parvibaculaceae bacterium]